MEAKTDVKWINGIPFVVTAMNNGAHVCATIHNRSEVPAIVKALRADGWKVEQTSLSQTTIIEGYAQA